MPKGKKRFPTGETPIDDLENWLLRIVEKEPEAILHTGNIRDWEEYLSAVGIRYGEPPTPLQTIRLWEALETQTKKGFHIPLHVELGFRMVRQIIRGKVAIRWFGYPEKRFIPASEAMKRIEYGRLIGKLPRRF